MSIKWINKSLNIDEVKLANDKLMSEKYEVSNAMTFSVIFERIKEHSERKKLSAEKYASTYDLGEGDNDDLVLVKMYGRYQKIQQRGILGSYKLFSSVGKIRVGLIKLEDFKELGTWPEYHKIHNRLKPFNTFSYTFFVSYKWVDKGVPDSNNQHYNHIKSRIQKMMKKMSKIKKSNIGLFIDSGCIPQKETDENYFLKKKLIKSINHVLLMSDKLLMSKLYAQRYSESGWCQFEYYLANKIGISRKPTATHTINMDSLHFTEPSDKKILVNLLKSFEQGGIPLNENWKKL